MCSARGYLGEATLLVKHVQDPHPLLNQVQHVLVVHKLNVAPVDGFPLVLSLSQQHSVASP